MASRHQAILVILVCLVTVACGVPFRTLGGERSLLDFNATGTALNCGQRGYSEEFNTPRGTGCVFLSACDACGDKKCSAVYETHALEVFQDWESYLAYFDLTTNSCGGLHRFISGKDEIGCPTDAEIDTVTDWVAVANWAANFGQPYNSADTAKAYMRENCANAPDNVHRVHGRAGKCVGTRVSQYYAAVSIDSCGNQFDWSWAPEICRINPTYVNETCAMSLGAFWGIDEAVTRVIVKTAAELHSECQKMTTFDECHAFDGSPWLKVLNETGTAADAANATVVVPASPPPAGDANGTLDEVSSQGGLLAGYIGAAVMGLISLLV